MYLSNNEIKQVLKSNYIGQLTFILEDHPHIIPITYFYDEGSESLISYSGPGQKIDAMRENPNVSVGVNVIINIDHWQTVIIKGVYEEISGSLAKKKLRDFSNGVKDILNTGKTENRFIKDFSSMATNDQIPIVYKINITSVSGRRKGGESIELANNLK